MLKLALESTLGIIPVFLQISRQIIHENASANRSFLFNRAAHQLGVGFDQFLCFIQTGIPRGIDARERRRSFHICKIRHMFVLDCLEGSFHLARCPEMREARLLPEITNVNGLRVWTMLLEENFDRCSLRTARCVGWPSDETNALESWIKLVSLECKPTGSQASFEISDP